MTYAELQSAIGDWLMRQDLTSVIPTFIELAEEQFNATIRVRRMIATATLTVTDGEANLPADWLESRNVRYVDDPYRSLEYVTLEAADDLRGLQPGSTNQFTIRGDKIEFIVDPEDGTEIELTYYAAIPALSDSNTTNWLLTRSPSAYLYGALKHSALYLKDDDRVERWAGLHDRALEEIRMEDHKAQWSGSTLKIRSRALG